MIAWNFASVFGLPYDTAILATTAVAAIAMIVAVGAVLFFALAPHISTGWASQFGSGDGLVDEEAAD